MIIFTKGRIKEKDMPNKLLMDDKRIEFGTECRYLGVTLDHRLSWTPHFTNITKRAKQYLFTLRAAVSKAWGPKPKLIK